MDSAELRTRVGVADLMARYQFLVDRGKTRQASELFTDDGVFTSNDGDHTGPEGVLAFFTSTKQAFIDADFMPARHHLSSVLVRPEEDGRATTEACFQLIGSRGLDHWGTYRDIVVPVGDTWMFAHRTAIVTGCVPTSPVAYLLQG